VQLLKEEEVGERRSGLAPRQALETLSMEAGRAFNRLFRYMRFGGNMQLSTKMAAELATRMTVGMMEPIYAQLDPIRLGEVERFVRISQEYGDRLRGPNVKKGTIEKLLGGYPSHEFVIDREEARELFERVEVPSDELELLAEAFIGAHHPTPDKLDSFISFLNQPVSKDPETPSETKVDVHPESLSTGPSTAGTGSSRGQARSSAAGATRAKENGSGRVEKG
jgi:hypothetical protein